MLLRSYTLRNAEYRLCLQKSLGAYDDDEAGCWQDELSTNDQKQHLNMDRISENRSEEEESNFSSSNSWESFDKGQWLIEDDAKTIEALGVMSEEARTYIQNLKRKLISATKVCTFFERKFYEPLHDAW